ncbi:hypothetical protein SLA2020_031340 [Shorea laevis]
MHGCDSGSALLVNAEVDSMGGLVDGGVGIGVKTSPHRAAIEKAQADLRQEYDVREERRKELEFLEKGGNPLDFKFGNATSVSVQSTSLTDQQAEHFVISEAKGSFAQTASPHGDSVESSGRPGVLAVCEPHTADNLLLFDGENELHEGKRNSMHRSKSSVAPSEQSSQMDGTQNAKESEDSAIFRPYARRNRSKINRDSARSSSTDMVQGRGSHGSSLPAHGSSKDMKGPISETNNQKEQNVLSISSPKFATSNGDLVSKKIISDNQLNAGLDNVQAVEVTMRLLKSNQSECTLDTPVSKSSADVQQKEIMQGDALKSFNLASDEPGVANRKEQVISAGPECLSGAAATKAKETSSCQLNGFNDFKRDRKTIPNAGKQNSNAAVGAKRLDSESSCTQSSLNVDVNNDNDTGFTKDVDANRKPADKTSELEGKPKLPNDLVLKKNLMKPVDDIATINENNCGVSQNRSLNDSVIKVDDEIRSNMQNQMVYSSSVEGLQQNVLSVSEAEKKLSDVSCDNPNFKTVNHSAGKPQGTVDISIPDHLETTLLGADDDAATNRQTDSDKHLKLVDKVGEDSILEEARIIEAKRKRIAELSVGTLHLEHCRKSHWDFVLEEMAWLANDFAQERLWKMNAAAQICRNIAFTSCLRFEEQNQLRKQKKVALSLANAVMQFWHSAQLLLNNEEASVGLKNCGHDLVRSGVADANEVSKDKTGELDMDTSKEFDQKHPRKNIQGYAQRFLKYNSSPVPSLQAEAPATPDRIFDLGIMEMSWDEHQTEESLFYAVPSGSMEAYRNSIESYLVQTEKTISAEEEVETSACDAGAEFGYHELAYDEDEGETSTYYLPGSFEGSKSSKANQKNRKHSIKSCTNKPYEMGADLPYGNSAIRSQQQSILLGKRPTSSFNAGSIPTKRIRTNSRHNRVMSPFNGAPAPGPLQTTAKMDASSGDTNSFQDDQSTLHGGSQFQKGMEIESSGDFEKHLPFDSAETPRKPKKKKLKHHGFGYDQGWQPESTIHNEQRDYSRKRFEGHHFDSNGTSGLYGQHNAKKPKIIKQHPDSTFGIIPSGSIPSPVASQVSNMSNPNKFIKYIAGRDRGRKPKGMKMSPGQPGSGNQWSLFEDQALVVLVHDMGPNWELVSDAINSTLQFKCIFRKPKECKERHKFLMDQSGDGADSADDSGSSQSYPSTLPGIPKGSARQLFQRLQGPMEEDTLKTHFENIIRIGKKQHYRRIQNENQDTKQMVAVHNSHLIALSQVCPNNLNGILMPLELCDMNGSGQDVLPIGYQPAHPSSSAVSNQGAVVSVLPTSGTNSSLQNYSAVVVGNNMSSLSAPLNTSVRDARYGVPRTPLSADEQHRMQQYNQMLSSRNIQQSNLSIPGAISGGDHGVRMLPGGNGMGIMSGTNRNVPISRPGFQGMASSSMVNSGSMISSNMAAMPNVNMHSGPGLGQGNSMLRPHDAMHMMQPGHNPEHQRQLMVPELQMQAAQGTSQGIPAFSGLSSGFPNQTTMPMQTYPGHPQQQQQHQMSSQQSHGLNNSHHPHPPGPNATGPQQQQQFTAIRLAKERQLHQQRLMQQQQPQQQQQFAASSALMPHVQPQSQLPVSSSLQNNSQIQSQASNQSVVLPSVTSSSPMTPMPLAHQQKHHLPPHGLSRIPQSGASGLTNQVVKQRERQLQQQFQQSGRSHPQQRQQTQSQQQAKLLKGMGRGNMVVHPSVDPSHLNGLSMPPGNQNDEKGEQMMHLVQGQGLYSAPGMSPAQPSKLLMPSQTSNHSQPQQKVFSGTTPPSKQLQLLPPHSDNSTQGQVSAIPTGHSPSAAHQAVLPAVVPSNHQHLHSPSQPSVQRVLQNNRSMHSDPPNKAQAEPQSDQQPVNSASPMGTTGTAAMPQAANILPVVSSGVAPQWKANEPGHDPTNSAVSDPVPSVSQGLGQRHLSGGLPPEGHHAGARWQQKPQLQPPTPQPSQQQYHSQEQVQQDQHQSAQQLSLQQQPQRQTQHLQAVQGSLYHKPSNSKLE